ncbi:Alpha/Beta hydrolase protein [Suillus ampliporus]|nr:Alpha/Beta hydrolase protein [Suillus ampliporus]
MYTSISASQWGSPTAPRRALLIHGITTCSNSWESFAQLLAVEGFFVVAPNLLGHAWRRGTDYSLSAFAEDLKPYLVQDMSYDVIIGHSLGGTVALSLLPFLPEGKETTVILLDPPLELTEEKVTKKKDMFREVVANVKTADEHIVENPPLSQDDGVSRAPGISKCDCTVVEAIFWHNRPWSFSGLFENIAPTVKITVLVADPKLSDVCYLEHIPRDIERLNARVLPGIGHFIHYESPDAVMDVIPLRRAKL